MVFIVKIYVGQDVLNIFQMKILIKNNGLSDLPVFVTWSLLYALWLFVVCDRIRAVILPLSDSGAVQPHLRKGCLSEKPQPSSVAPSCLKTSAGQ